MNKTILPDQWGTIIMALATLLSMILLKYGLDVPVELWQAAMSSLVMIFMRLRTKTPPPSQLDVFGVGELPEPEQ